MLISDCGMLILECGLLISARPGAYLRITLQHCLQTKTRQIAHYNVNGLGQGLRSEKTVEKINVQHPTLNIERRMKKIDR